MDEETIYEVTGGDYSIYCLGYTQARTRAKELMDADPWGGIPFVLKAPFDLSTDDQGNVVMSKSTLDKILDLCNEEE